MASNFAVRPWLFATVPRGNRDAAITTENGERTLIFAAREIGKHTSIFAKQPKMSRRQPPVVAGQGFAIAVKWRECSRFTVVFNAAFTLPWDCPPEANAASEAFGRHNSDGKMTEFLLLVLFPTLVIAAGIGDCLTMRIPNWLNGVTALAIFPMAFLAGMPLELLPWHLLAGVVMLVFGFGLFAGNYIGGGDAKLMAAAGLWIGWSGLLVFVLITAMAGGALAIVMKVWELVRTDQEVRDTWFRRIFRSDLNLPYGVAIAVGALWVYPATWWMDRVL